MSSPLHENTASRAAIRFFPRVASSPDRSTSFTVKDNYLVSNYPCSAGFAPPAFPAAEQTATVVTTLQEKGYQLLAACNMDPGAVGASGKNPYWGDMTEIPSGSSGGSALSVQKEWASFSLVTDVAGSSRLPAVATSLVGMKFGSRSVPRDGILLYHPTIDTGGILAKDLEILKEVLDHLDLPEEDGRQHSVESFELNETHPLSSLASQITTSHKELVSLSILEAEWLPKHSASQELTALKVLASSLDASTAGEEWSALKEAIQANVPDRTALATEISVERSLRDKAYRELLHPHLVVSNLMDWPALVAPIDQETALHLTGPFTERELLSMMLARAVAISGKSV